jgi:hypothetical protein
MGFSFGGAVTLLAAGATSNLAHLSACCGDRRDDPRACESIWGSGAKPRTSFAQTCEALPHEP